LWATPHRGGPDGETHTLGATLDRLRERGATPAILAFCREEDEPRAWSFTELVDASSRLVAGLITEGIERGEPVAVVTPDCPEWLTAFLGIVATGAAAVPLDVQLADEELASLITRSGARRIFNE
jgi:acyl-CoA synthetase (AMP-forming)/AMP-acid ligase II